MAEAVNNHGAFFRSIAELLCGDYKQSKYQKVVLLPVVIRRLDAALEKVLGGQFYDTPRSRSGSCWTILP